MSAVWWNRVFEGRSFMLLSFGGQFSGGSFSSKSGIRGVHVVGSCFSVTSTARLSALGCFSSEKIHTYHCHLVSLLYCIIARVDLGLCYNCQQILLWLTCVRLFTSGSRRHEAPALQFVVIHSIILCLLAVNARLLRNGASNFVSFICNSRVLDTFIFCAILVWLSLLVTIVALTVYRIHIHQVTYYTGVLLAIYIWLIVVADDSLSA